MLWYGSRHAWQMWPTHDTAGMKARTPRLEDPGGFPSRPAAALQSLLHRCLLQPRNYFKEGPWLLHFPTTLKALMALCPTLNCNCPPDT